MAKSQKSKPVLEVKDLSVGYGGKPILCGIHFSLQPGELMSIVGINGIGKSTLLRALGNMQPALEGSIMILEKSLTEFKPVELAATVSLVLTEPISSKNLSVLELIALGRQPYTNWIGSLSEADTLKIEEAVQTLGLEELQHRKCFELSDGQLQRVMIARALAQDTALILMDEPTTHLDLYHKVQILKLLKSIVHKTQKTIVFTSHEIEMAIQLSDKMILLDGETNSFGTPNKLIEQNAFASLFPADTLSFDASTGTFRIVD